MKYTIAHKARILKYLGCVALAVALLGWHIDSRAYAVGPNGRVAGQIVVQVVAPATIADINQTYGTTTLKGLAGTSFYLLQATAGADIDAVMTSMLLDIRIGLAESNFLGEPAEAGGSRFRGFAMDAAPYVGQYANTELGLLQAQQLSRGANIVVAVVDTGIWLAHSNLANRLTAARMDFIDGDTVPNDVGNGLDDDGDGEVDEMTGHGTHVAGIVHLVAPDARIMPVRVLNSDGIGDEFTIAQGVAYAADNGARVINLSLGTSAQAKMLREVIKSASRQGVIVVAAAGNSATDQQQHPAAGSCAIAVTAVGPGGVKPAFANFGSWIGVAAPGESIYSTMPNNGYAWWSGTSMATPFVAGDAALMLSVRPRLNAQDMDKLIVGTATSIDAQNPAFVGKLGGGELNILGSLQQALANNIPNVGGGHLISGGCN